MWVQPIYDRTSADVQYAKDNQSRVNAELKGALDYRTLNRIEGNIEYLSNILNRYNYINTTTNKTNWTINEYFYYSEMARILVNLTNMRNAFYVKPTTPSVPNIDLNTPLIYNDINSIERILNDINELTQYMENNFVYSGVANSGQTRVWQQRFRRARLIIRTWANSIVNRYDTWNDLTEDYSEWRELQ